jgi:hypothetical protein
MKLNTRSIIMLADELKDLTAIAMEDRPDWSEENEGKYHLKMVTNRLKCQAREGYHMCYFPHLNKSEIELFTKEGLRVTKKERNCNCLMGDGWFVDWFPVDGLERLQKELDKVLEDDTIQ